MTYDLVAVSLLEPPPSTGPAAPAPVFLDATGRRLKRARLAGGTVTAAVAAYVVLLLSAALGGPSIDAPFLPRPAAPTRGLAALPSATPADAASNGGPANGAVGSGGPASPARAGTSGSGAGLAPGAATTSPGAAVSQAATQATATSAPVATTGTPTPPATTPTVVPTSAPTQTGRSASAPGRTAHPTVSRTR